MKDNNDPERVLEAYRDAKLWNDYGRVLPYMFAAVASLAATSVVFPADAKENQGANRSTLECSVASEHPITSEIRRLDGKAYMLYCVQYGNPALQERR